MAIIEVVFLFLKKITSTGKDMEKLEPLCIVGGNVNW